ncbi:MAG: hypothetical protein EB025_07640 [Chitinophagaceae bacterium]|jgi:hypothetical protein|nr:hypothetical protein [Chitinophagia bacterium]NDB53930.1 hypothetical protein [Chitinophagaceae bacterium]HAL94786.1 hypothetical protein [Chitinophagaceae bacterium]
MTSLIHNQITDLVVKIRKVRTDDKLIELLDLLKSTGDNNGDGSTISLLKELRNELSKIDPISVTDYMEWTIIQAARVYIHRIMEHKRLLVA